MDGVDQRIEIWAVRKNGEVFPKEISLSRSKYMNQDVVIVVGTDISVQKNLFVDMQKEYLRKTIALQAGTIGVWEWVYATNTLVWDATMSEMYGVTDRQAENPYDMWTNALNPEEREYLQTLVEYARDSDTEYNIKFWINPPGRERRYIHAIGRNEYDIDGKPCKMVGINLDITQQKQYEDHLNELVTTETLKRVEHERILVQHARLASMGEMISNIAHQWRQPLNRLSVLKDCLVDDFYFKELDEAGVEKYSEDVDTVLTYMSQTIDDFRAFFKPEKEKSEFDIRGSINSAVSLIKDSLTSQGISLECILPESALQYYGLPNEFSQVIVNLLNNAKDAIRAHSTGREKWIEIHAIGDSSKIIVTVRDSGGGIPKEIISKIFDPYFTTKHKAQGTGLGLYMSKMIIEQNLGGKIEAFNIENGASFLIELDRRKVQE